MPSFGMSRYSPKDVGKESTTNQNFGKFPVGTDTINLGYSYYGHSYGNSIWSRYV